MLGILKAVFAEMDEEWAGRRWFNDDSIGRAVEGAKVNAPEHAYEGTAAEHAARIIALVVADNPIPDGKAAPALLDPSAPGLGIYAQLPADLGGVTCTRMTAF